MAKDEITVGALNVKTFWAAGRLELIGNEMKRYKCDILGIAEICWTGTREVNGGEITLSGEEKKHTKDVGFLLSPRAIHVAIGI